MDNDLYKIFENSKFNHKYYLKTFKGAGAFGAVFIADELVGDTKIQEVAIKAIRKDKMSSENIAKELITAIQLKDPHLINCITSEEGQLKHLVFDYPCFGLVMEIASGTLENYLQTNNPLKTKVLGTSEAIGIVQAIASGLVYLHGKSITHRDLKPANVLRVDSNWKISDFGIARKMGSESGTLTTSLTGTPIYMPPEVYEAQKDQAAVKVAPAWDMWSLGVMIVQMLTGELPFAGLADILQMKIAINGNLPAPFDVIVQNCLRQDPKERWTAIKIIDVLTPKPNIISPTIIIPQISVSTPPPVSPQFRREAVSPNIALQIFSFETAQITNFDTKNVQIERSQKQAQQFIRDLGNGIKLEMVAIPAGRFLMGAAKNEADASPDEYPQHPVNVPSFFMSKYPITQAQYQIIIGQNPSGFKGANKPVETVSWEDAKAFCQLLNDRTKSKGYRLPSEAEWEYACRAGTNTPFYFGGTIEPNLVNYNGNYPYANAPKGKYREASTDVASFAANGYGLYDMHGNVWEWCEDVWHGNYENAPTDGSTWLTDKNSSHHVLRGGSWDYYAQSCRSANRLSNYHWFFNIGFRVVMSDARGLS